MVEPIRIKPHHFVDILTSFGQGQREFRPHPYGHAVHAISERLLACRQAEVAMELGADDICAPCSHNIEGLCDDQIDTSFRPAAPKAKRQWNLLIDRRWCRRLGLRQGDRLTARQFARRLRERMGDIADIYREVPPERTADRAKDLTKGIEFFLQDA